jgi:tripartite-type tricarboxylate transporter receptor subunit TctC
MSHTLNKKIAQLGGVAALCFGIASGAAAQSWPAKPVRILVPFPAGSAPDIIARLTTDKLSATMGRALVVENRPGAGGIAGMATLVRSAPDGYTFAIVAASTVTLTPYLFKDPQFNVEKDLAPVAMIGTSPMMIAVNPSLRVQTLPDLIKLVKSQPGKVNFASPILNSVPHLTADMLNRAAGIQLYTVPYNGSVAAATATMTGEAAVSIDGLPPLVPHLKAGKLRAIAVTSPERLPGYENIPAAAETLPGFESIGWFGVFAPAGVPADIAERVNRDVSTVIQMPDVVARFADLGVYPKPGSRKAFEEFFQAQRSLWKKVVQDVGLQPQ